jgi:hypothetical protein
VRYVERDREEEQRMQLPRCGARQWSRHDGETAKGVHDGFGGRAREPPRLGALGNGSGTVMKQSDGVKGGGGLARLGFRGCWLDARRRC